MMGLVVEGMAWGSKQPKRRSCRYNLGPEVGITYMFEALKVMRCLGVLIGVSELNYS